MPSIVACYPCHLPCWMTKAFGHLTVSSCSCRCPAACCPDSVHTTKHSVHIRKNYLQHIDLRNTAQTTQVSAVCRTGYYQLRQLRPLVRCVSEDAVKTVIQAFINTRLDYRNLLYFGIADGLMSRLQSVQNAAARLVTGVRRCEHITPVLRQLH